MFCDVHRNSYALAAMWLAASLAAPAHAQDSWVVGQSAPLSGGNAAMGRDVRDGALAYFKSVNARGGVAGKPIELVTLDDANDRKTAGANATQLLGEKKAVALFGFASATLSLDAMPQADKAGTLFFAPLSGADPVRKAPPVVFTMRASYGEEMEKILAFWTGLGMKKVVVVHYDDEVGKQNFAVVAAYLAKHSGTPPAALSLKRNQAVEEAHIDQLREHKPDVVINTTLSGAAAEISKRLAKRGAFVPTFEPVLRRRAAVHRCRRHFRCRRVDRAGRAQPEFEPAGGARVRQGVGRCRLHAADEQHAPRSLHLGQGAD